MPAGGTSAREPLLVAVSTAVAALVQGLVRCGAVLAAFPTAVYVALDADPGRPTPAASPSSPS